MNIHNWFNSKYSQIYYQHKNRFEAEKFIITILNYLNAKKEESALDTCCGNGRYSIALNSRGLKVVGVDFSTIQIDLARKFENPSLKFYLNDIENFSIPTRFDYAFNMCSSFGYRSVDSNLRILSVIHEHLKSKGKLILDYWNPSHLKFQNLICGIQNNLRTKQFDEIKFETKAIIRGNFYEKEIIVYENNVKTIFHEKIMVITLENFKEYFKKSKYNLLNVFGNYDLANFNEQNSDRMIFILEKFDS